MTQTPPLPLEGVRIVDLSRLLPGPYATQMLGELGADVIKLEQRGLGDPSRYNQPRLDKNSYYFNAVNANKRSLTVDLTKPAGRAIAHRLLRETDVVVESYRPGVAKKLGVDYPTLNALNERLIYCSISGFGQTGPLSHIAGHDLVIQGLTGLMGCALDAANPPAVPGFQAADFAGALFAVIGIQAALAQRARSGAGCVIDLGMYESLLNMCLIPLSTPMAQRVGHSGEPRMESFGGNPRYATYLSRDGKPVAVSLLETKAWREFCVLIGRPDLVSETETLADRLSAHGPHHATYRQVLTAYCAAHDWAELMRLMEETGIAICPVLEPHEVMALPHVAARGLINQIDHPVDGAVPHLVNPLAPSGLARAVHRPAPDLGQHNAEILAALGYSADEIGALARDAVV
jgi:CoA:oxalate CoA-transferase